MRRYERAKADHAYLWSISPASDMTGAYEDQHDLALMLETPTKKMATDCLERQIYYWFEVGTADGGKAQRDRLLAEDEKVREIYSRYGGPDLEGDDE